MKCDEMCTRHINASLRFIKHQKASEGLKRFPLRFFQWKSIFSSWFFSLVHPWPCLPSLGLKPVARWRGRIEQTLQWARRWVLWPMFSFEGAIIAEEKRKQLWIERNRKDPCQTFISIWYASIHIMLFLHLWGACAFLISCGYFEGLMWLLPR